MSAVTGPVHGFSHLWETARWFPRLAALGLLAFSAFPAPAAAPPALVTTAGDVVLRLAPGWNLVALAVQPSEPAAGRVFGRVLRHGGGVWSYDPATGRCEPAHTIGALTAYWVRVPEAVEVRVRGPLLASAAVDLAGGWNLVGPAADTPLPSAPGLASPVWTWDAVGQRYVVAAELKAGQGYCLFAATAGVRVTLGDPRRDRDSDGVPDVFETGLGLDPDRADADGDGLADGWELTQAAAGFDATDADADRNATPDGADDWDADGVANAAEARAGTSPRHRDTDGDGLFDAIDLDPLTAAVPLAWPVYLPSGPALLALPIVVPASDLDAALRPLFAPDVRRWDAPGQAWAPAAQLLPGVGYAVSGSAEENAVILAGELAADFRLTLHDGWNLAVMPLATPLPADPRLAEILAFDALALAGTRGATPARLERHQAYWVRVAPGTGPFEIDVRQWLEDTDADAMDDEWGRREILAAAALAGQGLLQSIRDVLPDDDYDGDELANGLEFLLNTSPARADTDGDSLPDSFEVVHALVATALDVPVAAWWRLDEPEGATAVADSAAAGRFAGTLVPAVPGLRSVPGLIGRALELDGATRLEMGGSAELDAWPELSLSLWFRTASGGPLASRTTAAGTVVFSLAVDAYGCLSATAGEARLLAAVPVADEVWHHALLSVAGGTRAVLYLDGVRADAVRLPAPLDLAAGDRPLVLGGAESGTGVCGALDDLRLFAAALNLSQAQQLFQPGGDTDGDGLSDLEEFRRATHPNQADTDADGLADGAELAAGTDPNRPDSDGDGLPDGWEAGHGLDPLKRSDLDDPDGDGVDNATEYRLGLDPRRSDGVSARVEFETDTTTAAETLGAATVGVRLSEWPAGASTVSAWITVSGGTAERDRDYSLSTPRAVTFRPGQLVQSFAVRLFCDDEKEPPETVLLRIASVRGASPGRRLEHRVVIEDSLCADADTDGDGLPDGWERRYFGHLNWGAADDPDGDGENNLREYLLGRHPNAGARPDTGGTLGLKVSGVVH